MEEDIGNKINNFETILKTYCHSKSLLYSNEANIEDSQAQGLRSEDVIKNISKQIEALNHKETLSKHVNNKLKAYKESRLTCINNIMLPLQTHQNHPVASNFDNQYGFETQLIVATKNAEAIKDLHTDVTQEFETCFDQNTEIHNSQHSLTHKYYQETISNNLHLFHLGNEENCKDNVINNCKLQESECDNITSSSISKKKKGNDLNTSFLLEYFEKFEAIAAPLVHENSDMEAVKKIINCKMVLNNKVTSEVKHYDDKDFETASIHLSPILKLKTDQEAILRHINCDSAHKDDFVDEDIVFSSSEKAENDYDEVEELPMTCALQTSFYEQEHVLDKTIYVGFQTASNKSIQVLTNSFTKAKSILNDCCNVSSKPIQSLSLLELVEVYDDVSKEKKGGHMSQNSSFDIACGTKEIALKNSNHNNNEENQPREYGYPDVNPHLKKNKPIIYTEEQMKIDDFIMQEFEENICVNDNKLHTNSDVSNHPILFTKSEELRLNNNSNANSNYRSVQISPSDKEKDKMCVGEKIIETLGIDDQTVYQNNYERHKTNKNENVKTVLLTGFKTAANKSINISMAAFVKSKNIIEEVGIESDHIIDNIDSKMVKNKTFQGFRTASEKPINVSDDAYLQSDKIFKNIKFPSVIDENHDPNKKESIKNTELFEIETSKINTHSGFKTASNNPINISEKAIMISKKFLQEFNFDNDNNKKELTNSKQNDLKNNTENVSSKSNNPVSLPKEDLKNTKNSFEKSSPIKEIEKCYDIGSVKEKNNERKKSLISLNNVSTININNLANSRRILAKSVDQETEENCHNKESFVTSGFIMTSNKRPKICTESSIASKSANENKSSGFNNPINSFEGFKTANNKPVKISDEALEKSKNLFKDINDCNSMILKSDSKKASDMNTLKNTFQGFKTANNNPVKISAETLQKSKNIFQDISDYDYIISENSKVASDFNSFKSTFQGFKTASNKPVRISDDALEKCKKIFQDINNCDSVSSKVSNSVKNTFQSFKTANNNIVKISDAALEKSKTIFQDIIIKNNYQSREKQSIEHATFNNIGFQTINNSLSEEDFRMSKNGSEEIENNIQIKDKQNLKYTVASMHDAPIKPNTNVHEYKINAETRKCVVDGNKTIETNITDVCNLFNTEVINHFNDTMLTEDFINTSPSNKRSGSPILSCPKPKKMKTKLVHEPVLGCQPLDKMNSFVFSPKYKKEKKYVLLDLYKMDKHTRNTIQYSNEVNYDIRNIDSFEFVGARNELSDSKWTLAIISNFFLERVNKTIIPNGWVENHIKLITLKLLSYEKRFPNAMKNICSVSNVMEQLKYRYERELYNVERPALRKILEKDEVPSRRMVLQVLNILKNGLNVENTNNSSEIFELLLTDGWYCVKATLDNMLTKLVCEGKIITGTKLVTHGAELLHCEQGVAPWEVQDTSSVRLKINGNSTRRAHWAAKLGFHGNGAILSYLKTVKPEGGKISQLRVIITRVYPMLYVEKFNDGSTVTRSERLENLHQMKYEMERETMLEKIYEEVEKEFCVQVSQCDSVDSDRKCLDSGSQIYQQLKKSRDPAEFRAGLTYSQSKLLQDYIDKRREISLQDLQSKVQSLLKKRGLNVTRNVVAMLKIRVADVYKQNVTKAMITVWRPHDSLLHLLREGTWLDIYNVVPTAVRYSEIQISAGKQSVFRKTAKVDDTMLNIAGTFKRKCYSIQELTQNPYFTTDYNEVDTVGLVFDIEPSVKEFDCKKELFQNVFLADVNKKIICINFWGGLKKYGFDSILEAGQVVACINLQKRSGNTRKNIPQYRATEFTYFTKTPKIDVSRKACEDLSKQFFPLDRRKFVQDCIALRNNLLKIKYGNIENISPYRFNNSDYNLSKNKIFLNSPNGDPNLNLNGLDFESTFKQSNATLSPKALLRKKEVNERIVKLQKYGEPPPLGPIHIVNKCRDAIKPYRSPLISKAESSKLPKSELAAVKPQTATPAPKTENTSDSRCTSPVLPYKRTVNPVKLNFSKKIDASKDDPFGESFETSLPLSLD